MGRVSNWQHEPSEVQLAKMFTQNHALGDRGEYCSNSTPHVSVIYNLTSRAMVELVYIRLDQFRHMRQVKVSTNPLGPTNYDIVSSYSQSADSVRRGIGSVLRHTYEYFMGQYIHTLYESEMLLLGTARCR